MSDPDAPAWAWPEPRWRDAVGAVRAGRSLKPDVWPGGAPAVAAISFDSDHETLTLRSGDVAPGRLSAGEYGARTAMPRIRALLARHDVRASFFVPAVAALLHPEEVPALAGEGHEIGLHGWIHETNGALAPEAERDLQLRAADVLERLAGARPVGQRTPSWDVSPATLGIARELGLDYDSSLMADDQPYELVEHGRPTGMVEIPVEWIRDDAPYWMFGLASGARPHTPPSAVLEIWRGELRTAVAEGGVFQLTMHPHIVGHGSRLWVLEALLEEIRGAGLWVCTHAELSAWCRARAGLPAPAPDPDAAPDAARRPEDRRDPDRFDFPGTKAQETAP